MKKNFLILGTSLEKELLVSKLKRHYNLVLNKSNINENLKIGVSVFNEIVDKDKFDKNNINIIVNESFIFNNVINIDDIIILNINNFSSTIDSKTKLNLKTELECFKLLINFIKKYSTMSNESDDWREHWNGMPEFIQENDDPFQSIKVHFRNREDRIAFENLIEQSMTDKTKSIWFPIYDREKPSNFLYTNTDEK